MMSLKQKATPLSKLEIKPSFYKNEKLLHCELDINTLTNDGRDELWTSVLLGSSYVRVVTVLILFWNLTEFDLLLPF